MLRRAFLKLCLKFGVFGAAAATVPTTEAMTPLAHPKLPTLECDESGSIVNYDAVMDAVKAEELPLAEWPEFHKDMLRKYPNISKNWKVWQKRTAVFVRKEDSVEGRYWGPMELVETISDKETYYKRRYRLEQTKDTNYRKCHGLVAEQTIGKDIMLGSYRGQE